MTAYDAALSAIREHVDELAADLDVWADRTEPDARARRCASGAVNAIDAALRELYGLRSQLVGEIRKADDAAGARQAELLRRIQKDGGPPARA